MRTLPIIPILLAAVLAAGCEFAPGNTVPKEDYDAVDNALRKLFAGGGCLLPYSVFCVDRVTLGLNEYMGTLKNRISEDAAVDKDDFCGKIQRL